MYIRMPLMRLRKAGSNLLSFIFQSVEDTSNYIKVYIALQQVVLYIRSNKENLNVLHMPVNEYMML